jgi:hypothetical protein
VPPGLHIFSASHQEHRQMTKAGPSSLKSMLELTGTETGHQLVKQLVYLRWYARRVIRLKQEGRATLARCKVVSENLPPQTVDAATVAQNIGDLEEMQLQFDFMEIEIGKYLMPLCAALDGNASREAVFEALEVNRSDRAGEIVDKYGQKSLHIITVLGLESSATKDEEITTQPLKWCHTMAFMNALQTNSKLDRIVHDGANEFFNGVFGEFRERPLTERLAGMAV